MFNIEQSGVIHLTRGDTARISVQITNDQNGNGVIGTMESGNTNTYALKNNDTGITLIVY